MLLRRLLHLGLLAALILSLLLSSGCAGSPVRQPPGLRAKPTACFLDLPANLSLLPPDWEVLPLYDPTAPRDKVRVLLQLHDADGGAYAQSLTNLHDCQVWIKETP